jgi:hypothetical protein
MLLQTAVGAAVAKEQSAENDSSSSRSAQHQHWQSMVLHCWQRQWQSQAARGAFSRTSGTVLGAAAAAAVKSSWQQQRVLFVMADRLWRTTLGWRSS